MVDDGVGADPPPATDRLYAAAAAAAALLALAQGPHTLLLAGCVLIALGAWAPVLAGRAVPLGLFALLAIGPVAPLVLGNGIGGALFLTTVAASRIASRSGERWLLGTTALAVGALPFLGFVNGVGDVGAVYFAFGNLFGMFAGALLRRMAGLAYELRNAAARLSAAAAREDRQRIARDVHDLVAHSLTVVVLHVGGARRVLRADPAVAEQALADAERVCRESLDGIRGVVGLLRDDDVDRGAVSLDLEELAQTYRAAGLGVALTAAGDAASLPLLQRVTLHRVVQESLANAARYAGPTAQVHVEISVDDGAASVCVANARPAAGARSGAGGFGLVGLAERVAALGGELRSGPEGDRWIVRCRLPQRALV